MKEAYDKMSKKINQFIDLSRENDATIMLLKATFMYKQTVVNNHIDKIAELKQELEKARIEIERVDKNLISYSTSSYILDHILPKPTGIDESRVDVYGYGKNSGLGYHRVPPPLRDGYCRKEPVQEEKVLTMML
ncbi:hypothetical protein Hanom_Chr02g00123761 [Helianthus anomalus]